MFGPVRLPQPMGAGGQQPLRSHLGVDIMLRRPEQAKAFTVKSRVIWRWIPSRANGRAHPWKPTASERCPGGAKRARREARLGRKAEQGSVTLDAPASK
jgi:hypothetical protein